jgi:aminopeptidase N
MCRFSGWLFDSLVPDPRFALPGTVPQYAPDRNFKTEHIRLEFSFDLKKKIIFGRSVTSIRIITEADRVEFDAVNMQISSVRGRNNSALKFDYDKMKLVVHLDKKAPPGSSLEIAIDYKLSDPPLGAYFIGPDKAYPKNPLQVWTHSEAEEARYWYPCHDAPHEKFTAEIILTLPSDFFALSNGLLANVTEDKKAGEKTFHWKMKNPIPSYLIMFAVGKFSEIRDEWDGIPITYYCEKGCEDDTRRAFGKTPAMLEFFSKKTGVRYPYEKYAQVAVACFPFAGMEHTTATTESDVLLHDEKAHQEYTRHDEVVAHELAHQWFGDLLTCKDWSHAWLNESFATYFEALFIKHDRGRDEFLYEILDKAKQYFSEDKDRYRRPIVTNIFMQPGDIFDRHLYEKGAVILHMLKNILGNEMWWKCINRYIESNKHSTVETSDLIKAIEETTGKNMKKFFDQWVYGAGHPELKASYYWDDKTKEAVIRIAQLQKTDDQTPLFSLPLKIEIITKEGPEIFSEKFEENQKQFRYKMKSTPIDVRIDPDFFVLKKLEFNKPRHMWHYQLENDPNPQGRIFAAQEIAKSGNNESAAILAKQFEREKFWGVQAEIALAISGIRTETSFQLLKKMVGTRNLKVRRAVATALGEFKSEKALDTLKILLSDKNSYFVPMEAARSIGRTGQEQAMQILKKTLSVASWNDVIKSGALEGIAQLQTDESIQLLKEHASYGYNERSRMTAIRNLGVYGKGRKDVLDFLMETAKEKYSLIQIISVFAIGELGDERAIPFLEELTKGHRPDRVKRQALEAIRKIYPWLESDIETEEMKERYEKLKEELSKKGK